MTQFVGRFTELRVLDALWQATKGSGSTGSDAATQSRGACLVLSGPASVGKTRLIGEFLQRSKAPAEFFAAIPSPGTEATALSTAEAARASADYRDALARQLAASAVLASPEAPGEATAGAAPGGWPAALSALAASVPEGTRSVVVLDNAQALVAADPGFTAALRRVWEGELKAKPVLLVIAGRGLADLAAAFGDAATAMELAPFNPAELAQVLGLDPASAFDAYIASGGHADIAAQWPTGAGVVTAMETMLNRSPSVFEVRADLDVARTIGFGSQAEILLRATGTGVSSRAEIGRAAGIPPASLDRALKHVVADGLVAADRPRSVRDSREARYRLRDPYLRLWSAVIAPHREDMARGRVDLVVADLRARWDDWRRAAMLVVGREAMDRLAAAGRLPGTGAVGGFWNRFEDVRVDLVGTDRAADPQVVTFVGTLKWDPSAPFDHFDLGSLIAVRSRVPGVTDATPLVAVSLSGSTVGDAVAAVLGPAELLSAWQA